MNNMTRNFEIIFEKIAAKIPLQTLFHAGLVITAIYGALLIYNSTPYGVGQINDSAAYISGARSIAAGTGYNKLWLYGGNNSRITAYPPFTSLVLGGLAKFGLDPFDGFRGMNTILFGMATALIGIIGAQITKTKWIGLFIAIIFSTHRVFITVYSYAISEPLYLFLVLIVIEFFYLSISRETGYKFLLLGIATGLASLTRNAGLAIFLSLAGCLFLFFENRLKLLIIFACGYGAVSFPWAIYNRGSEYLLQTPRTLDSNLIPQGWANLLDWLFLSRSEGFQSLPFLILDIAFYILIAIGILKGFKEIRWERKDSFTWFIFTYSAIYVCTLFFSIYYVEESIGLSDRILSPLYLNLLLIFIWGLGSFWKNGGLHKGVVAVLTLTIVLADIHSSRLAASKLADDGQGYSSLRFRNGPIAEAITNFPPDLVIFTNSPPALYSATNGKRSGKWVPIDSDFDLEKMMRLMFQVSGGNDFAIVCYGCAKKDYQKLEPITERMNLIEKQSRDALFYWDSTTGH